MSKTLRPSAGYMGRGVIDQSAVEYMLYHQNSFAQVKPGRTARHFSQSFFPRTTWFDCFQNWCSASVRSYQPFATAPWPDGGSPVRNVLCAVHVTAGSTGFTLIKPPAVAACLMRGVCSPIT